MIELKQIWKRRESASNILRLGVKNKKIKDLPATDLDVLACISANPTMTIQKLVKHDYFSHVSLSTIKRSVLELTTQGLIKSETNPHDKRERHLVVAI